MIFPRLAACSAAAVLAAAAAMAQPSGAPEPETHVSPEGHEFTLLPVPEADYVQVGVFWPGSAALAVPGKEGIYQIGPNLAVEEAGGRSFDEIQEDMSDAGTGVTLATALTGTILILQAQDVGGLDPAAELASDILTDPALAEDDLDWLKSQTIDALREAERDPGGLMDRALNHLLADGDRRASGLTGRPFETIEAVTTGDVADWMAASFGADALIAASGPLNTGEAGAAIDTALAGLGARPAPVPLNPLQLRNEEVTAVIDAPEAETAIVGLAFTGSPTDPAITVAMDALAGGDGSRLFTRLREVGGATYGVEPSYTALTPQIMSFALIASVPPDRAAETLAALREELSRIRADGVTEAELAAARERQAASEEMFLRDPNSLIGIVLDQADLGKEIDPEARRESVTMTDLAAINDGIAAAIPEGMVGAVVTPEPDLVNADCTARTPEELGPCR